MEEGGDAGAEPVAPSMSRAVVESHGDDEHGDVRDDYHRHDPRRPLPLGPRLRLVVERRRRRRRRIGSPGLPVGGASLQI